MESINIVGAGLAGLSAAMTLAEAGIHSNLISVQPSERAQSVLAEGGINGVLDTMGEADSTEHHFNDTMAAGGELADEKAVRGLVENAPHIIRRLYALGVPFYSKDGVIQQRSFGGQKKKRTAFAKSSTGKVIMSALIDEVRRHEAAHIVTRYPDHEFLKLVLDDCNRCAGVVIMDSYRHDVIRLEGPVILAVGGMNGLFHGLTTGTTVNSGDALARVFSQGVRLSNLEMIQYHPTTIGIPGKRCLISEAARSEGGRLYIERQGKPWYFMEEKYPELGNLMPRDVISREMHFALHDEDCGNQVYLDLRALGKDIWSKRLPDLRNEVMDYLGIDPAESPVPVEPGIHYFMGGIDVDDKHRASIAGLYAAGECCSQYHGANRLGGNSMLGAIYGGLAAASSAIDDSMNVHVDDEGEEDHEDYADETGESVSAAVVSEVCSILSSTMLIVRNEETLQRGLCALREMARRNDLNTREKERIRVGEAMVMSAIMRRESRGAHYREDYPRRNDSMRTLITALFETEVKVAFRG